MPSSRRRNIPKRPGNCSLTCRWATDSRSSLRETGNFPPVRTLATLENLPNYKQEWIDVSMISAEVARPNHFVPKYVEWWNAARKELDEVWVGRKTAQEAADAMCPAIDAILAEA